MDKETHDTEEDLSVPNTPTSGDRRKRRLWPNAVATIIDAVPAVLLLAPPAVSVFRLGWNASLAIVVASTLGLCVYIGVETFFARRTKTTLGGAAMGATAPDLRPSQIDSAEEQSTLSPAVRGRWRPALIAVGLAGFLTITSALWVRDTLQGTVADREAKVSSAASTAIEALFSYSATTLDEDKQRALNMIADQFSGEYDSFFQSVVTPTASVENFIVVTDAVAAAPSECTIDACTTLVLFNQTSMSGSEKIPTTMQSAATVNLVWAKDAWKVAGLTPLT